jgi:hypothetical protein
VGPPQARIEVDVPVHTTCSTQLIEMRACLQYQVAVHCFLSRALLHLGVSHPLLLDNFPRLSHVKTGLLTLNQHIPRTAAGEQRRQPQTRTTSRSIVINTDDSEEMPPVRYLRIASNGNPHLHSCDPLTSRPPRCYNPWPTSRRSNYFSIPHRELEHPSP